MPALLAQVRFTRPGNASLSSQKFVLNLIFTSAD